MKAATLSLVAVVGPIALVAYWIAIGHPFLLYPWLLPTFAWTGAASSYAFASTVPAQRTTDRAASATAIGALALAAVLFVNGFLWPKAADRLVGLEWVQCAAFVWAANLSLAATNMTAARIPTISRLDNHAYRAARTVAFCILLMMAGLGIGTLFRQAIPDWVREGLLPAATQMVPWLCAVTGALVGYAEASRKALAAIPAALLVACALAASLTEDFDLLSIVARSIGFGVCVVVSLRTPRLSRGRPSLGRRMSTSHEGPD